MQRPFRAATAGSGVYDFFSSLLGYNNPALLKI